MKTYRIATIPGDGIGHEVLPAARLVLDAVAEREGFALTYTEFPWGCDYYLANGRMMDDDARLSSDREVVRRMAEMLAPYKARMLWSLVLIIVASAALAS